MLSGDSEKENLTVKDTLVVHKRIVTPTLYVGVLRVGTELFLAPGTIIQGLPTADIANMNMTTLHLLGTSNQLTFGPNNEVTLNVDTTQVRTITFPSPPSNANVVLTEGTQTINGSKTFGSGILLPTTGGTATPFQYYEEFSSTMDFQSGAFAADRTAAYDIVRTGTEVMIQMATSTGAGTGGPSNIFSTVGTALPERFRPVREVNASIIVMNDGVGTSGTVKVLTTGAIEFYRFNPGTQDSFAQFVITNSNGFLEFAITYKVT